MEKQYFFHVFYNLKFTTIEKWETTYRGTVSLGRLLSLNFGRKEMKLWTWQIVMPLGAKFYGATKQHYNCNYTALDLLWLINDMLHREWGTLHCPHCRCLPAEASPAWPSVPSYLGKWIICQSSVSGVTGLFEPDWRATSRALSHRKGKLFWNNKLYIIIIINDTHLCEDTDHIDECSR